VQIHNATANNEKIAARFATDDLFHALRVEPYLLATAKRHEDVADRLRDLADRLMANKIALVHGDVSPKNILDGARGPVFLDAECAWYGEPAFDVSFCLNHLLLKCLWNRSARSGFLGCFETMASTYFEDVAWEPRQDIEQRTAALLPALMLARVDGKSPVEYVNEDSDKNLVRRFAKRFLQEPADNVTTIAEAWASELDEGNEGP
jgi:aminoglycoside phosphotransferase (APT) family kinase protein